MPISEKTMLLKPSKHFFIVALRSGSLMRRMATPSRMAMTSVCTILPSANVLIMLVENNPLRKPAKVMSTPPLICCEAMPAKLAIFPGWSSVATVSPTTQASTVVTT